MAETSKQQMKRKKGKKYFGGGKKQVIKLNFVLHNVKHYYKFICPFKNFKLNRKLKTKLQLVCGELWYLEQNVKLKARERHIMC